VIGIVAAQIGAVPLAARLTDHRGST